MNLPLQGRRVALPETRELDLFASMLEERGAQTVRCPLVAILDAPDAAPIEQWIRDFIATPCDDLILLTGEGLRRLLGFAERAGLRDPFIAALAQTRTLTRGPKPGRALREIGLKPDILADEPTTDGVISSLNKLDLQGHRVGVQLYGTEPNLKLISCLAQAGAHSIPVAPYVYASQADETRVLDLIDQLVARQIDVIAFTSTPQIKRLIDVAKAAGRESSLREGLAQARVAAIGPIVAEELKTAQIRVDLMPEESFFMKPLVRQIVAAVGHAAA